MSQRYNQFKAMMAVSRASFRAIFRSPSSVVFSLLFPLIFILVFGFIGGGGVSVDVGLTKDSDTSNAVYYALKQSSVIKLIDNVPADEMNSSLEKGHIDAIIDIKKH